jgi:CheY-like chemotaxis protein
LKLLIVEDDAKTAAQLQKGLAEHGFVVDISGSGDEGLRLAKASAYDLLVLDVMLPGFNGWEVISARTAVMETLFPGTDHEMRSVYFLDGPDLVLTHYCAMGNQPRMKLAASSTASELVFEFAGGTNLDPARDMHVHDGRIRLLDADRIEAEWAVQQEGQEKGRNRFFLSRAR